MVLGKYWDISVDLNPKAKHKFILLSIQLGCNGTHSADEESEVQIHG